MTRWEFVKQLDRKGFARWLVDYTMAVNGIEESTEEDLNDLIELTYRMLDEEIQIKPCKHHDISRED